MSTFSFGGTNLKKGASGNTVKKIQEALNASGNYNLSVDGIWGDKTDAAIRDYQKNNGLSVDGIYGQNTHNALFGIAGGNTSSRPKEPESYSEIDLSKYDSGYQKSDEVIAADKKSEAVENALANLGDYTMSDTVIEAGQKKTDAENAVGSYGDFAYGNQNLYDDVINKIMNREKFSYDLNGDALYQQYKDKYIQQGKTAMQDTMGQAAAMTGGYGNSYAATAGNQAYQASLENLNNIVPELYQMAYDRYNQEGQDLLNQYAMLSDDRNAEYGMWSDGYNRLLGEREYYANGYYNAYNMDYSQYVDKYNRLNADRTYYADRADSAYAKDYGEWSDNRAYDSNQYWNETNFGYGQYRDSVADWENERAFQEAKSQFERQQALNEEQWEWQKEQASKSNNGGSGSGGGGGNNTTNPEPTPPDPAQYADWDAGDWNSYFAQIRQSEGKTAAEEELNYFTQNGLIPKNMVTYAAIGARGSLGH
jgi:peptidoglycan hydrolase-like protein with peptidoglycan-binding domain